MSPNSKIPRNVTNTQQLRSMARRRSIKLRTISQTLSNKSEASGSTSDSHLGKMSRTIVGDHSDPIHGPRVEIPVEDPDKPSTDLRWIPRIVRRWWMIRGRSRSFLKAIQPSLTPDQLEAGEYKELKRERDKISAREGRRYIRVVSRTMLQIGNSIQSRALYTQKVRWLSIARDEGFTKIFLSLDLQHVPTYILPTRLNKDPRWTDDLAAAVGLPVSWAVGDFGAILTIHRSVEKAKERKRVTVEDLLK